MITLIVRLRSNDNDTDLNDNELYYYFERKTINKTQASYKTYFIPRLATLCRPNYLDTMSSS